MADGGRPLEGRHVLLGVCGGIAAYKAAELARALLTAGASVQALLTDSAARFVGPATFEGLTGRSVPNQTFDDAHRVNHVRLAREADVAVVAPATANALARFAHGLADDLLSSVFTCLTCPVVVAPAMHTEMWEHAATRDNVATLVRRGTVVAGPASGPLAGGDDGPGRLLEPPELLAAVVAALDAGTPPGTLSGLRVLVTAGGTREPIDPVRYVGNRSSGKMGYAIAAAARARGATVHLVSAATALADPDGVDVVGVETALQMRDAVLDLATTADVVVKAAAVADFRPETYSTQKLAKRGGPPNLTLVPNPDILAELGKAAGSRVLVGFAAETDLEEERGRDKLHRKGLDLIVVNRVDMADAGFAVDTNRALLLSADGGRVEVPLTTKVALADVILDVVEGLVAGRR